MKFVFDYAVVFAVSIAMWLSFVSRKPRLSSDNLRAPEEDIMVPEQRVMSVAVLTSGCSFFLPLRE